MNSTDTLVRSLEAERHRPEVKPPDATIPELLGQLIALIDTANRTHPDGGPRNGREARKKLFGELRCEGLTIAAAAFEVGVGTRAGYQYERELREAGE
jgi:hypothetical protein